MRPSWMDQYFAPIPSTPEIRFFLTKERYTNLPENMRLFYQIISDPIITDLSWCYDRRIQNSVTHLRWSSLLK